MIINSCFQILNTRPKFWFSSTIVNRFQTNIYVESIVQDEIKKSSNDSHEEEINKPNTSDNKEPTYEKEKQKSEKVLIFFLQLII